MKFFLGLGVLCGFIAGLMVFLITYAELVKHYPDKKYPRRMALQSAFVTFIFFLAIGILIGFYRF